MVAPEIGYVKGSAEQDDAAEAFGVAAVLAAPALADEAEELAVRILGAEALADVGGEGVDLAFDDVADVDDSRETSYTRMPGE